ncbi:hypothetical protein Tco_0392644 [Tanacetum coccineum]
MDLSENCNLSESVGAAVVVVWCGVVVVVVFLLRWWSGVTMENYQDPPVTLTIRNIDGVHITGQMLLDKINDEEFSKLQDEDVVAVCQLDVLHLILLGRQPAHNIPEWWFRYENSFTLGIDFMACHALPMSPA